MAPPVGDVSDDAAAFVYFELMILERPSSAAFVAGHAISRHAGLLDFPPRLREREIMSGRSCLCRIIIIRR
jgi:hypothetical protein